MKHVKQFENFVNESENTVNEGLLGALGRLFKRDKKSAEKGGKVEGNFVEFEGRKFSQDQIEYDDYSSTKTCPRVEGGKLIIANPYWSA
jgi:hypothetical protein